MIDTQNTEGQQAGPSHARKAGDTPALGLAVVPGSGGRRYAPEPEPQPAAPLDSGLAVDEPVMFHDRAAWVVTVYPASAEWTRPMCKIRFPEHDGKPVVVGVDEVDRCTTPDDLAAHQQARALMDTAPLPSPVPRILTAAQVRAELAAAIEGLDEVPETVPAAAVLLEEKPAEDDRPTERLAAVGALPKAGGFWSGLLDVLRIIGAFLAWPVRRDGGRALLGRIVDGVADGVDEATDRLHDWLHAHALLLAKVIVAALSVAVLGAAGVAWLLTVVAR